jgi:hypothetical protein
VIEALLVVLWRAGYRFHRSSRAFAALLDYLRGLGVIGVPAEAKLTPVETLLERYHDYLRNQRCLAASSARVYLGAVRAFLASVASGTS